MTAARPVGGGGSGRRARAHGAVETDDPLTAEYRRREFFPTWPWASRAGAELIQRLDPGPWTAEEPACGQGHMAEALRGYFPEVHASDRYAYGYGEVRDFLADPPRAEAPDWIVTNPPFRGGLAERFVEVGLMRARRGVAILQQTTFLDTVGRHDLLFGARGLTVFAQFAERVGLGLGDLKPSTATPYAWFVWIQPQVLEGLSLPFMHAGGRSCFLGMSIPPGTRARLTHADDARRWLVAARAKSPKRRAA